MHCNAARGSYDPALKGRLVFRGRGAPAKTSQVQSANKNGKLECIVSTVTFAEKQMMKEAHPLFKPSKSSNGIWNVSKTILQTAVFWLVFLYVVPVGILKFEKLAVIAGFQPQTEIGWTLFLLFSLLGIYSGYTMSWIGKGTPLPLDCPNELVIQVSYLRENRLPALNMPCQVIYLSPPGDFTQSNLSYSGGTLYFNDYPAS